MISFEATWRTKYEFFERYYCSELKKSLTKKINLKYEWYEPISTGEYSYILDDSIKLEKKEGRSKDGNGQYGLVDPMYRNIRENYWNNAGYNPNSKVWYIDIETRSGTCSVGFPVAEKAAEPISLMQIYDSVEETMIILGLRDWKHQADYKFDFPVKYIKCKDEIHLLEVYLDLFKKLDPLIIYAWHGAGFDFPYIHNRMKLLGMDVSKLSNYGNVKYSEFEYKGSMNFKFSADGHYYLDLEEIYDKFTFKPVPNLKLDTIAEIELKEKKVDHSEYAAFDDFYTGKYIIPLHPTDKQKKSKIYKAAIANNLEEVKELAHSDFVYYGAIDTHLLVKIDKKKNFTSLLKMIAEEMGVQLSDSLGTVKPWAQFISNKALLNNQVMPIRTEHSDPTVIGGHVRECLNGKYSWVLSIDVNSMYPLLSMVGSNMSPETYVSKANLPGALRDIILIHFNSTDEEQVLNLEEEVWNNTTELLQKYNLAMAINGAVFKKDKKGLIPDLVHEIYKRRKVSKTTEQTYEKQKVLIENIIKEKL